jgi:hypothetical protein
MAAGSPCRWRAGPAPADQRCFFRFHSIPSEYPGSNQKLAFQMAAGSPCRWRAGPAPADPPGAAAQQLGPTCRPRKARCDSHMTRQGAMAWRRVVGRSHGSAWAAGSLPGRYGAAAHQVTRHYATHRQQLARDTLASVRGVHAHAPQLRHLEGRRRERWGGGQQRRWRSGGARRGTSGTIVGPTRRSSACEGSPGR